MFVCVGNDDDVRSVVYGEDGILAGLKPGAVLVDHTTTSAELAIELAKSAAKKWQSVYRCTSIWRPSGRGKMEC
ncbi:NAD(P)-binding domain-containing protein [Vibrio sinaloensis]|nr:NAD(P)-binding domain-containing protein [Vibrio sinaloensis]